MNLKCLIFVAGGTLGHINPACTVIKAWRQKHPFYHIIFIATSKEKKYHNMLIASGFDEVIYLNLQGISRKISFNNIITLFKIWKANSQIKQLIKVNKPQVVIGMGGYISGVVVRVSNKMKIPVIVHEQNSIMGLANRLCLNKCKTMLVSMPVFITHDAIKVIGNPRLDEAKMYQKFYQKGNRILVVSGTLGAKVINDQVIAFLSSADSLNYQTTFITGERYYQEVKAALPDKSHYKVLPFSNQLLELMSNSNLIISRSGATSIFEIIGLAVPAILIPSPNVTDNHQYFNAKYLLNNSACSLILEDELNLESLNKAIKNTINNQVYRDNLQKLARCHPTADFVKEIEDVTSSYQR